MDGMVRPKRVGVVDVVVAEPAAAAAAAAGGHGGARGVGVG